MPERWTEIIVSPRGPIIDPWPATLGFGGLRRQERLNGCPEGILSHGVPTHSRRFGFVRYFKPGLLLSRYRYSSPDSPQSEARCVNDAVLFARYDLMRHEKGRYSKKILTAQSIVLIDETGTQSFVQRGMNPFQPFAAHLVGSSRKPYGTGPL
jgi:hypothetical protein